ncbi:MAG: hypothetical protein PHI98_08335 [Eubacteriales bacterium]|nr:hypothetical protein [Eubacteriales bacterium]
MYIVYYCNVPKQWRGAVTISSGSGALERREIWQSSYAPSDANALTGLTVDEMNAGTMYKEVSPALGGGYFAATNGASTTLGYSDIVIEGNLMRLEDEEYLELNLRNETTSPSNVLLKIYGDDTLLLTKEFQNVACGALEEYQGLAAANTMTALDTMQPYDNGYVTEGYDPNHSELKSKNGYINLTFPVSALTQGREFYKLTAVLETPKGFESIDGAESDSLEFVLKQTGLLTIDIEPDDITLKEGTSGRMAASFTGGLPPYNAPNDQRRKN